MYRGRNILSIKTLFGHIWGIPNIPCYNWTIFFLSDFPYSKVDILVTCRFSAMEETPVRKLNASLPIPLSLLTFSCEWEKCENVFKNLDDFSNHMTQHLNVYFNEITEPLSDGEFDNKI